MGEDEEQEGGIGHREGRREEEMEEENGNNKSTAR